YASLKIIGKIAAVLNVDQRNCYGFHKERGQEPPGPASRRALSSAPVVPVLRVIFFGEFFQRLLELPKTSRLRTNPFFDPASLLHFAAQRMGRFGCFVRQAIVTERYGADLKVGLPREGLLPQTGTCLDTHFIVPPLSKSRGPVGGRVGRP